eukprot:3077869-Pleurochrysis_carterae.AAC.1
MRLDGADEAADCNVMRDSLKMRFGNRAANVLSVLKLWEAFGKVYSAACDLWSDDITAYRAVRALQFLRS